jgi:hypothetical protein
MQRGLIALSTVTILFGLTFAFASPARAVNCDVSACINICQKKCPGPSCQCPQNCMQTIEGRKKNGQCK